VTIPSRRPGDPRADHLRARHHALWPGAGVPVPVESIAEDLLGLAVGECDDLPVSGLLIPARREVWLHGAEARESPGRRRFTLAHEVGHWVCQCTGPGTPEFLCRSVGAGGGEQGGDAGREREANVFAATLLMPEDAVRRAVAAGWDLSRCAAHFAVSDVAMGWRWFNLGLLPEPPAPA
jgi:hypothetical protein